MNYLLRKISTSMNLYKKCIEIINKKYKEEDKLNYEQKIFKYIIYSNLSSEELSHVANLEYAK